MTRLAARLSDTERIVNHPPHILSAAGEMSPSSLIPFCQLGDDMTAMGRKVPHFTRAVCSAFRETVLEGQVCYEVDVNKFRESEDWKTGESMEFGVGILVDTNEEYDTKRFYPSNLETNRSNAESSLRSYVKFEDSSKVKIYLHTLGG